MRKIITTLALMGGLGLYAHGAVAQEDGAQILKPSEGWSVTPARFGADDTGLKYCYLRTAYDNGFVFRFRGDSAQLSVLDINFRQAVFNPGQIYNFQMSIDDNAAQSVDAKALTKRSLRLDMGALGQTTLLDGGTHSMSLRSQHQAFVFHLDGLDGGIDKLKECAPVGAPVVEARAKVLKPVVMAEAEVAPVKPAAQPSADKLVRVEPERPVSRVSTNMQEGRVSRANMEGSGGQSPVVAWKAMQGEHPRNVIARWANKAGRDFQWDVSRPVNVLSHSFAYQGSLEDAVGALLNESYGAGQAPQALYVEGDAGAKASGNIDLARHFVAIGGDSLFNTLQGWSARAGVKLIWLPEDDVAVPQDGVEGSDFNTVVGNLLARYADANPRVVGTVYQENSGPVLVIEQVR